nr:unnamed protein product [Callosobruchus analis]
MSTSTRLSFNPQHNSTSYQQSKPNWIAEELFNTDTQINEPYETFTNESYADIPLDQNYSEPHSSETADFNDQFYHTENDDDNYKLFEQNQNFPKDSSPDRQP